MPNTRLLIKKDGLGKYMSHLDLMHTMERVFNRAGIRIWHTQGFNPHPYMSFCMPLSVGVESICEIMDFRVEGEDFNLDGVAEKLNKYLPSGVTVLDAYTSERKTKEIVWLELVGEYIYDDGSVKDKIDALRTLYSRNEIVIERKTKRGFGSADIAPNIKSIELTLKDDNTVSVHTVIAAQNPSLNPAHLVTAIAQLTPDLNPDFTWFRRIEVFDGNMQVFR